MLAVWIFITCVALSSASQHGGDCTVANTTFYNDASCQTAVSQLSSGHGSSTDTQMICHAGQQCNTYIRDIMNSCGDHEPESPMDIRIMQHLLCVSDNSTGFTRACWDVLFGYTSVDYFAMLDPCLSSFLSGNCSTQCSSNLVSITNTGCCVNELFTISHNVSLLTNEKYGLFVQEYPQMCGMNSSFCEYHPISPVSVCVNATNTLYDPNDECARGISTFAQTNFSGNPGTLSATLFLPGCAARFRNFLQACQELLVGVNITQLEMDANRSAIIADSVDSNGRSCGIAAMEIVNIPLGNAQDTDCAYAYLNGSCTDGCRQLISNMTRDYGCCASTVLAAFLGLSTSVDEQIEYMIYANSISNICGSQTVLPAVCQGVNVPYTTAATTCTNTVNSLFGSSQCLAELRILESPTTLDATLTAAQTICQSQSCQNRLQVYVNRDPHCIVPFNERDYEFGDTNIIGNTTCRNNDLGSCYAFIAFNTALINVGNAFGNNGTCSTLFSSQTCTTACKQIIQAGWTAAGCCLSEYTRVGVGAEALSQMATLCDLPINVRCEAVIGSGDRSVRATLFSVLLLGAVAMLFI
ncbi:uncharacterized protein [Dysidea avara]|uniref:uncharacterized protein n=1 Tax=Dysidea avara TaxID=196820 RepID=UPI0033261D1E